MSALSEAEVRIRDAKLGPDDLDSLREVLARGHSITRSDGYALIREIDLLQALVKSLREFIA